MELTDPDSTNGAVWSGQDGRRHAQPCGHANLIDFGWSAL
jgi:hypothetical protein